MASFHSCCSEAATRTCGTKTASQYGSRTPLRQIRPRPTAGLLARAPYHGSVQASTSHACCAGSAVHSNAPQHGTTAQRRDVLLAAPLMLLGSWTHPAFAVTEVKEAVIRPELAPDQSRYDPADPDLRDAAALLQKVMQIRWIPLLQTRTSW